MHALLLVSVLLANILPTLASTLPEPIAHKGSYGYHDGQKCLSDSESRDLLARYTGNFETVNEASMIETFTEDYTYESDSTSFFLRKDPGTKTVVSRSAVITALRTDQALGAPFTVSINMYTHTCDTIVFRYRLFGGRVFPSAIGGIDWLFVDLKSRKIKSSQAEFNSAAILYNYGALGPPNATQCLNGACEGGDGQLVRGCSGRRGY